MQHFYTLITNKKRGFTAVEVTHISNTNCSSSQEGLLPVAISGVIAPTHPLTPKAFLMPQPLQYWLAILPPDQKHFDYRNYYDSYFTPLMEQLGYTQTPHCTRHTCISMLTQAHVDQTMIKKIVGHSGAMTLTERVYTHLDIQSLVDAINQI